jgi:hypothetical protein
MKKEFINFVHEIFPSISPYTKEELRKAIDQFEHKGNKKDDLYNYFKIQPLNYLAQGDIIEYLPFVTYDNTGEEKTRKLRGILLSNTCDCENDESIVFSPLLPLSSFKGVTKRFTNNLTYNLLYFPDSILSDYIVDFGIMNTFPKKPLEFGLSNGKLTKVASLNTLGYYLFLTKLTVHLLRPEDTDVQKERAV